MEPQPITVHGRQGLLELTALFSRLNRHLFLAPVRRINQLHRLAVQSMAQQRYGRRTAPSHGRVVTRVLDREVRR